jgi:hypothetical protein
MNYVRHPKTSFYDISTPSFGYRIWSHRLWNILVSQRDIAVALH